MASWQATSTVFLLRHLFKRRLAQATDVFAARKVMKELPLPPLRGARIDEATVGGVAGEWVTAAAPPNKGVLLYLHGGGYFACTPRTYRDVTGAFALDGWRVFAPAYRLAPEHPFPAGLDDAVNVYRELIQHNDPRRIVIAGDSAGGGLCVSLLLRLREASVPMPAAAALFSPFADLAASGESIRRNSDRCAMFTHTMFENAATWYVGAGDVRAPLASPVYADLHGLPPLLIHVGEDETLLDDSVRLAANARRDGVAVDVKLWPRVPHVWQVFHRFVPEGRQSLREASAFLASHSAAA